MTQASEPISIDHDKLHIHDFIIDERDIINYFKELTESKQLEKEILRLLRLGIEITKNINTKEQIEYVDKAFDNLDLKFKEHMNEIFNDNGKLSNLIDNHFGENGVIVKKIFDSNNETSPLFELKKNLNEGIEKIFKEIVINKGKETATKEAEEKGIEKGFKFENFCLEKLEKICKISGDYVVATGTEKGKGGSKKGDIVITIKDFDKKIVFELKTKQHISRNEIQSELTNSMQTRNADYGIFVSRDSESLPNDIGSFNECGENMLVCAVQCNSENIIADGDILRVAYNWAKTKLQSDVMKGSEIDSEVIHDKLSEIRIKIDKLKSIKSDCSIIEKSNTNIRTTIEQSHRDLLSDIDDIIKSL